jgi:hypothetical protein
MHELATNSAKYGALSVPAGRVSISWSLSDARLTLEWHESDGPIVTAPTHRGFGMRLLPRAMERFGGTVEISFASTGLVCQTSVDLPQDMPSLAPEGSCADARSEVASGLWTQTAESTRITHEKRGLPISSTGPRS